MTDIKQRVAEQISSDAAHLILMLEEIWDCTDWDRVAVAIEKAKNLHNIAEILRLEISKEKPGEGPYR
jgi:hypothetical protein